VACNRHRNQLSSQGLLAGKIHDAVAGRPACHFPFATPRHAIDQDLGFTWSTRTTYTLTGAYGEINNDDFLNSSSVVEMDATLAEVAFHDNPEDALIMRDPRAATNFPLKAARPIPFAGAAHYLLFADRDRWTERND
jgi:hypothetical protein